MIVEGARSIRLRETGQTAQNLRPPSPTGRDRAARKIGVIARRKVEEASILAIVDRLGFAETYAATQDWRSLSFDALLIREGPGILTLRVLEAFVSDEQPPPVLTLCDTIFEAAESIRAGASGAVLMDDDPSHLDDAICDILDGILVVPAEALPRITDPAAMVRLDPMEITVLREIAAGAPDAAIAERCSLSRSALRSIVGNLLVAFDADSRTQAVVRAHMLGLVS